MKSNKLEDMSYKQLVKILDGVMAEYIKKKYEIKPGLSQCYTCKKYLPTEQVQAGHYIPRRYHITRFDTQNIRPQCAGCNGFRSGSWLKFRHYLVEEIGEGKVKNLESLALSSGEQHFPKEEIIDIIHSYQKP